jgi:hypothetical protein|tara:strand:+ start:197 stop:763 length:567 start_codon:yes stop_codon:yes gene_type:complete
MKELTLIFSFVTLLVLVGCTKPLDLPPENADFHFNHYERVKVNANHPPWVSSEIDLKEGDQFLVLASGKVTNCRSCGSPWIDQPPNEFLYIRIGDSRYFHKFEGKIVGNGAYHDFNAARSGVLQFVVIDWKTYPPEPGSYKDNSGSFLLDVFVYDPEQKEGFNRFLRAMIQKNPEDSMFTDQAEAFLK